MLVTLTVNVALLVMLLLFWPPHHQRRFQRLSIATFGALVGSLIGRMLVNPSAMGHVAFVAAGAVLFATLDWARRSIRSTSSRA